MRISVNASNLKLQEQDVLASDLNMRLLHFKGEFDSGRISQQEYEYLPMSA
jgi:hypothetical protein